MKLHVHWNTMVIYIQYIFHIIRFIYYLVMHTGCRNSSYYTNLWPLLKPIQGRKIVCMKLKWSSQPCIWEGGRGYCMRGYWSSSNKKLVWVHFVLLCGNMRHSGKCPLIPGKCLSYSWRAPFRVGISADVMDNTDPISLFLQWRITTTKQRIKCSAQGDNRVTPSLTLYQLS